MKKLHCRRGGVCEPFRPGESFPYRVCAKGGELYRDAAVLAGTPAGEIFALLADSVRPVEPAAGPPWVWPAELEGART